MRIGLVGGGVFGLSTAWEASKRGHLVDLFERDEIPSTRSAGNDISKAIRLEYGALTPKYAPLVERAFSLWRSVEEKTETSFFHNTGVLTLAGDFSADSFEYLSWKHLGDLGHQCELLEPAEGGQRFPQFDWCKIKKAIYNPMGGWLNSALATRCLERCASMAGTQIHQHAEVQSIGDGTIAVGGRTHHYDAVIVAAGAWVGRLLPTIAPQVRVSRQRMAFFRPKKRFDGPVWLHDPAQSGWYGFPMNAEGIVKIALHQRAETVDPDASRELDSQFLQQSRQFAARMLPGLEEASAIGGKCCFYTNSPTGDIVLDRVGDKIWVAGLGSGHGFKFGPVLGQLMLHAVESGTSSFPLTDATGKLTW